MTNREKLMRFSLLVFSDGIFLSSRAVASQVFSTQTSLTSVFGMGTGAVGSRLVSFPSSSSFPNDEWGYIGVLPHTTPVRSRH